MKEFKLDQKVLIDGKRIGFVAGFGTRIDSNKQLISQVLVDLDPYNVGAGISVKDEIDETYIRIIVCHPDSLTEA